MMLSLIQSAPRPYPLIRYIGDPETGIVHAIGSSCVTLTSESFLDLRTAIIRGYKLCSCCQQGTTAVR